MFPASEKPTSLSARRGLSANRNLKGYELRIDAKAQASVGNVKYRVVVDGTITKVPNNASVKDGALVGTVNDGQFDTIGIDGTIQSIEILKGKRDDVLVSPPGAAELLGESSDSEDDGSNGDGSNGDGSNGDGSNGDGSNGETMPDTTDPNTANVLPEKIAGVNSGYVILGSGLAIGAGLVGYTMYQEA